MQTILYLLRHGATEANLARPYRLQGRRIDSPLAPLGVRQAERARDWLASQSVRQCYSSPLLRAVQTADIIAAPHGLAVQTIPALTECDVGVWEGLTWDEIRERDAEACRRFEEDPGLHGYPGGESYRRVAERVVPIFEQLLECHVGNGLVVVAHHVVNRVYLAGLLGLPPGRAKEVTLDNCGISTVIREGQRTWVEQLNAVAHLNDLGAAA